MTLRDQLYPLRASPRQNRASGDYNFDDDKSESLSPDQIPAVIEERAGGELNGGEIADIIQAAVVEIRGSGKNKMILASTLDKIIAAVSLARLGTPNPAGADGDRRGHMVDSDEEAAYSRIDHPDDHDKTAEQFLTLLAELIKNKHPIGIPVESIARALQDALPKFARNPLALRAAVVGELVADEMSIFTIDEQKITIRHGLIIAAITENTHKPEFRNLLLSGNFFAAGAAIFAAAERKLGLAKVEQNAPDAVLISQKFASRYAEVMKKIYAATPAPSPSARKRPDLLSSLRNHTEPVPETNNVAGLDTMGMDVSLEG